MKASYYEYGWILVGTIGQIILTAMSKPDKLPTPADLAAAVVRAVSERSDEWVAAAKHEADGLFESAVTKVLKG